MPRYTEIPQERETNRQQSIKEMSCVSGYSADDELQIKAVDPLRVNISKPLLNRVPAFPWGINPINPNLNFIRSSLSTPASPSNYRFKGNNNRLDNRDCEVHQFQARHSCAHSSGYDIEDDREYIDTTEITSGLGTLFDLLKSLFSLVSWTSRSPNGESSAEDSDRDIETGLLKSVNEVDRTTDSPLSAVMTPLRFPSTINELFNFESPASMSKTYPLPEGELPLIPLLPLPRLRNEE